MRNYINTLRTGELLVDMQNYDIYVTEEGINIPIPITKGLREAVLKFINTELDTVVLKKSQISDNIAYTIPLYEKINKQQQELFDRGMFLHNRKDNEDHRTIYLSKVNQNNINQLGDINIQLNDLPIDKHTAELKSYIDKFNQINNDHAFRSSIEQGRKEMMELWNNIVRLMDLTNMKLDSLGNSWVEVNAPVIRVEEGFKYDVNFDDWLDHHERYMGINANDRNQWTNLCKSLMNHATDWFFGRNMENGLSRTGFGSDGKYWYGGGSGSGMLYKGLPYKKDLDLPDQYEVGGDIKLSYPGTRLTGSLADLTSHRDFSLDAMAMAPVKGLPNTNFRGLGGNDLYNYIANPANWTHMPTEAHNPRSRWDYVTPNWTGGDKYDFRRYILGYNPRAGATRYKGIFDVNVNKINGLQELDLDAVSYVDPNDPSQRKLKDNYKAQGDGRTQDWASLPVVANSWNAIPDLGGMPNGSLYTLRTGIKKRIREIRLGMEHYTDTFNKNV